ncbi:ABC transporter ATP-binding protein [Paraburkholderia sp. Ac-20336]|uniref:ABC transporter ATP-binding protein n=1 Tax=Burkholderiaceae TaxID=119060 RepID=UPI001421943B|nr:MULTISPECIES: ABC transporter ATP-binding protein [Burkholderiaceae]MBN3804602.1 ABC transporter ATP-binding protein [Paraburkholderia sp. Ac-20336]MBN3849914.1 ABC transporter ATP-binding protein [Paraburkholderia sp. Ac-20342]NIF56126.1 ABC transporter ATP-binding protein [Burkholderia sp. Ax-1724]
MLELIDISKHYPVHHGRDRRLVLDKINLTVRPGQKWGILGRNGAGKSTLIRIMSGSDLPNSGVLRKSMTVSWPLAFGDAFQGSLTGRDNARLISRVYGIDPLRTIEYVKQFAELGDYLNEPVKTYSAGMRSRLAFAISMSIEFDCFLIDEAMAVGDHRFAKKCDVELFQKRGDRAMVIVTHQTELIEQHCDHAALLEKGRLKMFENVSDAITAYKEL